MDAEGHWELVWYEDERGRSPVEAFMKNLGGRMRSKVARALHLLEASGPALPMPHARPIAGEPFWELRAQLGNNIVRIFYFAVVGRRIVLLHGFIKKDRKTPRRELDIARRRLREVVGRQA